MYYAIAAVIALILDQLSKYYVSTHLEPHELRELIPGVLNLTHETNTGAAFNFLEGARWFFVVLCVVFVAVVIYLLAKGVIARPAARWSASFVMAGAVGNCLDRVISGEVVDMLDPALLRSIRFPVFNVADVFITVGVVVFILSMLRGEKAGERAKTRPAPAEGPTEPEAPAETEAEQPAPANAPEAAPEIPPRPKKKKETPVKATAVKVAAPPEPKVESFTVEPRPAAQRKAPAQKPEAEDFDLESILSEFREL